MCPECGSNIGKGKCKACDTKNKKSIAIGIMIGKPTKSDKKANKDKMSRMKEAMK